MSCRLSTVLSGAILALSAASCGERLRVAPRTSQQVDISDKTLVDFPPPPAAVEAVPPDPGPPCVWVDGHYRFIAGRWQWADGGWFVPPPNCAYAPPQMAWIPEGNVGALYFQPGRWLPTTTKTGRDGKAWVCAAPRRCRATTARLGGWADQVKTRRTN